MDTFSVRSGAFQSVSWNMVMATGEEALSELYSFSLTVLAKREEIDAALHASGLSPTEMALLGQSVLFKLDGSGIDRRGIIVGVSTETQVFHEREDQVGLRLEIAPRAWLLKHRKNSRIFQGKYLHQIVSQVLYESEVRHRWNLANTYPKRLYCVQYDETDYDFVARLFAEEGIYFYFEHPAQFTGGPPPPDATAATSGWDTASNIASAIGTAASTAGGILGSDTLNTLGSGANVVADFLKPAAADPEADDPITIGAGTAGPNGEGDVLVFADRAAAYIDTTATASGGGTLSLTLKTQATHHGAANPVTDFTFSQRVRTKRVELRDYDFRRPMLLLQADAGDPNDKTTAGDAALEVYDHHGEYEKPEVSAQVASVVLEQRRRDAQTAGGASGCARLSPGHSFQLEDPAARDREGKYTVVRVRHESYNPGLDLGTKAPSNDLEAVVQGCARAIHDAAVMGVALPEEAIREIIRRSLAKQPDTGHPYHNRFECVPADHAFRPPQRKRPTRTVTESAVVVGPIGQEIYTDKYGRVKIQFQWDREGKWTDAASCWVRVVQTWSGAGFGFQFVPRVGMEVLVTFLAGDPDRPVVVGSLYNATHITPEPLPQRLTRSGIRTQTSPGGGGFNELSFEDQKGVERIHIHAQKDLHEIVNDTHTLNVKNNQSMTVSAKQEIAVGADQRLAVGDNQVTLVGKSQAAHVAGSRVANVLQNETSLVQGNALAAVTGIAVHAVKTDDLTLVDGDQNVAVHGNLITQVGGNRNGTTSNVITFVQGSSFHTATERLVLRAEKPVAETTPGKAQTDAKYDASSSSIRLECGDSFVQIEHDKITLSAKNIEIKGTDSTKIRGKDVKLAFDGDGAKIHGDPIELQTPKGAELTLDADNAALIGPSGANVQGKTVHLHSGQSNATDQQDSTDKASHTPNLKLRFTHLKQTNGGSAIANTVYRVVVEDLVYEGTTDRDGHLQVWVPETAKVAHVMLRAHESYADIYPEEEGPLQWLVHLSTDKMPAATDPKGARMRLRNLGYDPGTDIHEDELDDVTKQAVIDFQLDHGGDDGITVTGKLEEKTPEVLTTTYGS